MSNLHPAEIPRPVFRRIPVDELPATIGPEPSMQFIQSIAANGVLEPVLLVVAGEGFKIMAGNRRVAGARRARVADVPAMVFEKGSIDPATITLIENAHRSSNPTAEMEAIAQLRKRYSEDDVVNQLGINKKTVRARTRLFEALDESVLTLMRAGKLSLAKAQLMARLTKAEQLRFVGNLDRGVPVPASDLRQLLPKKTKGTEAERMAAVEGCLQMAEGLLATITNPIVVREHADAVRARLDAFTSAFELATK